MTDLIPGSVDTYGNSHDWRRGKSHQWAYYGGPAHTPWTCLNRGCGAHFLHFYHDTPDIREAMREAAIVDVCPGIKEIRK